MKFEELLALVSDLPAFESSLLLAGESSRAETQRQLSRWTRADRLIQLRKGLYALAPPFARHKLHPFVIANALVRGSYVSAQSALAHYGMIPEFAPATTSVCASRPATWDTVLGRFEFRHLTRRRLIGYTFMEVAPGQRAFVAGPEKALLDLIYLQPGGDAPSYLHELRLQNLDRLNLDTLDQLAGRLGSPKLSRAVKVIAEMAQEAREAFVTI